MYLASTYTTPRFLLTALVFIVTALQASSILQGEKQRGYDTSSDIRKRYSIMQTWWALIGMSLSEPQAHYSGTASHVCVCLFGTDNYNFKIAELHCNLFMKYQYVKIRTLLTNCRGKGWMTNYTWLASRLLIRSKHSPASLSARLNLCVCSHGSYPRRTKAALHV